jgi:hypothetical protein
MTQTQSDRWIFLNWNQKLQTDGLRDELDK